MKPETLVAIMLIVALAVAVLTVVPRLLATNGAPALDDRVVPTKFQTPVVDRWP